MGSMFVQTQGGEGGTDSHRLRHHIKVSLNPNWVGTPQTRKAVIKETKEGQFLVLQPLQVLTEQVDGKAMRSKWFLTWKRLPDNVPKP